MIFGKGCDKPDRRSCTFLPRRQREPMTRPGSGNDSSFCSWQKAPLRGKTSWMMTLIVMPSIHKNHLIP